MNEKNLINEKMISNLSDEQLDELLAYAPKFSEISLAKIEARSLERINGLDMSGSKSGGVKPKRKMSMKRLFTIAAAAVLLLATSTIVFAAITNFDFGHVFNSFFNNPAATNIMEVGKTVEQNGIKATLLYGYTDGEHVYVMLELRDVQENRIGDDIRLVFNQHGDSFSSVSTPVIYDGDEGRVVMGISMSFWDWSRLDIYDDISLVIESILTGAGDILYQPIDLPLCELAIQRDMIHRSDWDGEVIYRELSFSVTEMRNLYPLTEPELFLKVGEMQKSIPGIDWAVITNIGFHNGMLHLQTRRTDAWCWHSNNGHFRIIDRYGEGHWPIFGLSGQDYSESVFYVGDIANLADMRLGFSGVMADSTIYGPWSFTFPVTAQAERVFHTADLLDSRYFSRIDIRVSPMATTIYLYEYETNIWDVDFDERFEMLINRANYIDSYDTYITLADGSIVELYRNSTSFNPDRGRLIFVSLYFDITQIRSITILGVEHPITAD